MVYQKENGDHIALCASSYIDIHVRRCVIEDASLSPMHRPPNDSGCVGICATAGIDTQLSTKCIGRIGCSPGNAGAIAGARCDIDLSIEPCSECTAVAPHAQAGRTPIGIDILHIGQFATQDKGSPTSGQLARRTAIKTIEIAYITWYHIGRIARVSLCPQRR